jgi:hypothetical protein
LVLVLEKVAVNRFLFWAVLVGLLLATPAYAYVDPSAQGLISQSLTPLCIMAAAIAMFFRDKALAAIHWIARRFGRMTDTAAE